MSEYVYLILSLNKNFVFHCFYDANLDYEKLRQLRNDSNYDDLTLSIREMEIEDFDKIHNFK